MIALALFACSGTDTGKDDGDGVTLEPQQGAVLSSFRFGWVYFNHRLSHLELAAAPGGVDLAIIGGTSTTLESPDLGAECDPESCKEFPFRDQSEVAVGVSVVESETTAIVSGSVSLETGRDGASGTITATLPDGASGPAAALLAGLRISTDHPLPSGEACYHPGYGWHPQRISVALGAAVVDGDSVSVPVDVAFAAGNSNDPDRVCVDDVNEEAVVAFDVTATFLVGRDLVATDGAFTVAEAYPFGSMGSPPEQVEPEAQQVDLGAATVAGIAALDFRFYDGRADGQGAYLRTLAWEAAPTGEVNATATNWSPGTQLEDFEYVVDAVARGVTFDGTAEGYTVEGTLETELDASGAPVVHSLPAP